MLTSLVNLSTVFGRSINHKRFLLDLFFLQCTISVQSFIAERARKPAEEIQRWWLELVRSVFPSLIAFPWYIWEFHKDIADFRENSLILKNITLIRPFNLCLESLCRKWSPTFLLHIVTCMVDVSFYRQTISRSSILWVFTLSASFLIRMTRSDREHLAKHILFDITLRSWTERKSWP